MSLLRYQVPDAADRIASLFAGHVAIMPDRNGNGPCLRWHPQLGGQRTIWLLGLPARVRNSDPCLESGLAANRPRSVTCNISCRIRLRLLMLRCNTVAMRIVIVDENAGRASIIEDGLSQLPGGEVFVLTERRALMQSIQEIEPDIVLIDLGNPSRDVLEEYFAVSRALARPIAMFVDEADDDSIAASIDAGVSAYVVNGLASHRIKSVLDLAVRRFEAFSRLQADLAEARGKLAERETIDKAKRIIMDSKRVSEPEAYAELRRKAMSSSKRIAQIAEAVVTAHDLLGEN